MKNIVFAATAIVSAATMTVAARAADVSDTAYDWSGFYLGLNAGAGFNNSKVNHDFNYTGPDVSGGGSASEINNLLDNVGANLKSDETAFTGGGLIGYNWQHDKLVFGVEADLNYAGFGNDRSNNISNQLNDLGELLGDPGAGDENLSATARTSFGADWFATLRGRVGFAADNFLFYGTGGLAYGKMEGSVKIDATELADDDPETDRYYTGSTDATNLGWTVGGGMEYGIDNWSLGIEYLYVDLGSANWRRNLGATQNDDEDQLVGITGKGDVDYQFSVVRASAKLRF
ncbi:MAG: porin family protein [Aestuariivirga sp.]|uniref:outer membrane protein n=1 Tax=Aestuariivirga sp. TaxID=2650926 RepID=UPI0025BA0CE5|nr:outer membrane beta-barrel protein [Aestuariivirga sp.]MCA3559790.1 porin family protein [Aestuariivirga sp.]